jgi:hypothetical protein
MMSFQCDDKIMCLVTLPNRTERWFSGIITSISNNLATVTYEDGIVEEKVTNNRLRYRQIESKESNDPVALDDEIPKIEEEVDQSPAPISLADLPIFSISTRVEAMFEDMGWFPGAIIEVKPYSDTYDNHGYRYMVEFDDGDHRLCNRLEIKGLKDKEIDEFVINQIVLAKIETDEDSLYVFGKILSLPSNQNIYSVEVKLPDTKEIKVLTFARSLLVGPSLTPVEPIKPPFNDGCSDTKRVFFCLFYSF